MIIFDAYGVCLSPGYPETAKYLAKKYHRNTEDIYAILYKKWFNLAAIRKITQADAWRLAVKELELPIAWQKVRQIHYELMSYNRFVLNQALKLRKQYQISLLSKNTRSQFYDMQKRFPVFRKVFGSDMINTWEYKLPKASRETMDSVFAKYGVKAEEVLYTDDQEINLEVPRKMGVKTIFFKNNKQWLRDLNKMLKV